MVSEIFNKKKVITFSSQKSTMVLSNVCMLLNIASTLNVFNSPDIYIYTCTLIVKERNMQVTVMSCRWKVCGISSGVWHGMVDLVTGFITNKLYMSHKNKQKKNYYVIVRSHHFSTALMSIFGYDSNIKP